MSETTILRVKLGDREVEVRTCLTPEQNARAVAQWPDGVVNLAQLLDARRATAFPLADRRWLARKALQLLGRDPGRILLVPPAAAPQAPAVGAFADRRTTREAPRPAAAPPAARFVRGRDLHAFINR